MVMETLEQRDEFELSPSSAYEIVTRTMVDRLAEDVREIRNRINGMFWLVAGTVIVDVVIRVTGIGS
jgi:hypothetical protein